MKKIFLIIVLVFSLSLIADYRFVRSGSGLLAQDNLKTEETTRVPRVNAGIDPGNRTPEILSKEAKLDIKVNEIKRLIITGQSEKISPDIRTYIDNISSPEAKAESSIVLANTLSRSAAVITKDKKLEDEAVRLYKEALPVAEGELKIQAANNYGALLLRKEKPGDALHILKSAEQEYSSIKDNVKKAQYLYNLALAYEKTGDLESAAACYRESSISDPRLLPASQAVLRLLSQLKQEATAARDTSRWLNTIIEKGNLEIAERSLKSILSDKDWYTKELRYVLESFVKYLSTARVGIEKFNDEWITIIPESTESLTDIHGIIDDINSIYNDNLPVEFEPRYADERYRKLLRSLGIKNASVFIKMTGDDYLKLKDMKKALSRFAMAWSLDNGYSDAAFSIANILLNNFDRTEEANTLLNRFMTEVYKAKGIAYLGDDWDYILRFHMVLGAIYTKLERWESDYRYDNAVFQYEHALKAYRKLGNSKTREEIGPVAGIQAALARAYEGAGNKSGAVNTYLEAINTAIDENDKYFAREIMQNAFNKPYRFSLDNAQIERITSLRNDLGIQD